MEESILKLTNKVIDCLIEEASYQSLLETTNLISKDKSIQKLIQAFKETEAKYNDALKHGQHHPDLKDIKKNFQASKIALYSHPVIIQHKHHEKEFQHVLNDIANRFDEAITPKIHQKSSGGKVCSKENV